MGNKSSSSSGAALPGPAQLQKRFSPEELRRLEAQTGAAGAAPGGSHAAPVLTREQFLAKFGEGLGPATRRVLARLFAVLDANGSGALEHEEFVSAAFFFTKATPAERLRVVFSMYESPPPAPASSSSSFPSSGHLTKNDMAALCAEMAFALAEVNPSPPRLLAQLGADGGSFGKGGVGSGTLPQNVDAAASPFRELASVMVDVALAKYDADRDGRLSFAEFQPFAQHHAWGQADSGVEAVLQSLLAAPYARQLWPAIASGGAGSH